LGCFFFGAAGVFLDGGDLALALGTLFLFPRIATGVVVLLPSTSVFLFFVIFVVSLESSLLLLGESWNPRLFLGAVTTTLGRLLILGGGVVTSGNIVSIGTEANIVAGTVSASRGRGRIAGAVVVVIVVGSVSAIIVVIIFVVGLNIDIEREPKWWMALLLLGYG
jgi:hypothetical protein